MRAIDIEGDFFPAENLAGRGEAALQSDMKTDIGLASHHGIGRGVGVIGVDLDLILRIALEPFAKQRSY